MNSRELIKHPGEEVKHRRMCALGQVNKQTVHLSAGDTLMNAVAALMDKSSCQSGVLVLDGAQLGPFSYVMPGPSKDGSHAAWYSDTYACELAQLSNATAIVGKRDGQWWLHCHATWIGKPDEQASESCQNTAMGHLLPDEVVLAADFVASLYAFNGGEFDVQQDTETHFPLFHVQGGQSQGNAFIAKIFPHEDIVSAIEQLTKNAGFTNAKVLGIGSLIGTRFENSEPMLCPISEVLIGSDASWTDGALNLPMLCVDIHGNLYSGKVVKDGAPVTVTFELMVIEHTVSV